MGRPKGTKKYTKKTLERAVQEYFDSISREVELTEKVDTGKKDKDGHVIYENRTIQNKLGQPMKVTEFLVPPNVQDLCDHLVIHRSTWWEYSDSQKNPELAKVCAWVKDVFLGYREKQLLTRPGKDIKGIVFDLENNYGYAEKRSVEFTGGIEEYLAKLAEQGQVQEF